MKTIAIAATWLIGAVSALATVQVTTPLRIDSAIHQIHGSVLSPSMIEHFDAYKKKHGFSVVSVSTNNYKGYRIWLAVVDQRLIIRKIYVDAYPDAKNKDIIGTSIPWWRGLHADWFSGELIEYFDESSMTHLPSERVFVFEQGRFVKTFERKGELWEEWRQREEKKSKP